MLALLGLVLARIRWSSEQNLNAITTEALRVRTVAIGYARFNIFCRNGALKAARTDSEDLNSEALSALTSSFGVIRKICLLSIVVQVS